MARRFNSAASDVITVAHHSALNATTSATWVAWIYPETGYGSVFHAGILSKRTPTQVAWGGIWIENTSGKLWGMLFQSDGTGRSLPKNTVVTTNTWHHVALVANAADAGGMVREYLDGTEVGSISYNGTIKTNSGVDFFVGYQWADYFKGRIAEAAQWNVALSVAEVQSLARGASVRSVRGGLAWYAPLWGLGSPEPDLSGNGNHGVLTGTTAVDHAPVGRYAPMPRPWGVRSFAFDATKLPWSRIDPPPPWMLEHADSHRHIRGTRVDWRPGAIPPPLGARLTMRPTDYTGLDVAVTDYTGLDVEITDWTSLTVEVEDSG